MSTAIVGGLYEHYKGGRYVVTQIALHHDTREQMIVYVSLTNGSINVRPYKGSDRDPDGWSSAVGPDGPERFKFIGMAG
jgi:hypothetical protein